MYSPRTFGIIQRTVCTGGFRGDSDLPRRVESSADRRRAGRQRDMHGGTKRGFRLHLASQNRRGPLPPIRGLLIGEGQA